MMSIVPLLSQRETAPDDAFWLSQTVFEKALSTRQSEMTTDQLSEIIFAVIERFDATAAFKYALDHKLTRLPSTRAKRPKY